MDNSKINKAADILYNSRINLKKIKVLPEDCIPKSIKEAYEIQNEVAKRYLTKSKETLVIGKKIGCTNKAAQIQLNVKESFFGNIFSNNISKSNCVINSEKYFSPFVEPEFSFIMKDELDISKAPHNVNTVYESILAVLPSIEIVDSRYEDWTSVGVNNLIADNAVHAHWIFGNEVIGLHTSATRGILFSKPLISWISHVTITVVVNLLDPPRNNRVPTTVFLRLKITKSSRRRVPTTPFFYYGGE